MANLCIMFPLIIDTNYVTLVLKKIHISNNRSSTKGITPAFENIHVSMLDLNSNSTNPNILFIIFIGLIHMQIIVS